MKLYHGILVAAAFSIQSIIAQAQMSQPQYSNYHWRSSNTQAQSPLYRSTSTGVNSTEPEISRGANYFESVREYYDANVSPSDRWQDLAPLEGGNTAADQTVEFSDRLFAGNPQIPTPPRSAATWENRPALSVRDRGDLPPDSDQGWCRLGPERKLFPTSGNGFSFGGWNQMGYHTDVTDLFNDRPDRFNLHQQWFYFEKQGMAHSPWGFRADLVYGIDGQQIQAFGNPPTGAPTGWDNDWDFGSYGWAFPQLYASYQNCNWHIKAGRFFAPFGFEHIPSARNFFYTRSFARNFLEPYGMTGILAERQINESRSILVGVTTGWDTAFDQNNSGLTAITGTRFQLSDNVFFSSTGSWGNTGFRGDGVMSSNYLEVALSKQTYYVLQGDVFDFDETHGFSIIHYLFHQFNPCLQAGARLEWWKTNQIFPTNRSTWSLTNGINYRPTANFTLRPEARLDWGAGATDSGRMLFGVDGIWTF